MPVLHVVICSVREGRMGAPIAHWFMDAVSRHGKFEGKKIDLKEVALPLLSEPNHPRQKKYEQETTKRWSASVESADAFAFVTPEYNYGTPPALVNALDHVFHE